MHRCRLPSSCHIFVVLLICPCHLHIPYCQAIGLPALISSMKCTDWSNEDKVYMHVVHDPINLRQSTVAITDFPSVQELSYSKSRISCETPRPDNSFQNHCRTIFHILTLSLYSFIKKLIFTNVIHIDFLKVRVSKKPFIIKLCL